MDRDPLTGRTVAFLVAADGAEQAEALESCRAVTRAGGRAVVVHPDGEDVGRFKHLGEAADRDLSSARAADYDALVLPGCPAGGDPLRDNPDAARFVTAFFLASKPIAAICRAPGELIDAGLVRDRMVTSSPGLRDEITEAGGVWFDYPVVVCCDGPNVLLTARGPRDLSAFCEMLVDQIART